MSYPWPDSLPTSPLEGTLSVSGQDSVLRGPSDIGQGEVRRRATASSQIFSFQLQVTAVQLQILKYFYDTTLGGGVQPLTFLEPVLKETKEFRFLERYQVNHHAGGYFRVSMSLIGKEE